MTAARQNNIDTFNMLCVCLIFRPGFILCLCLISVIQYLIRVYVSYTCVFAGSKRIIHTANLDVRIYENKKIQKYIHVKLCSFQFCLNNLHFLPLKKFLKAR